MEAFVIGYPSSIVKEDALEQAMAAYQSVGDSAKVLTTAERILGMDPDNIRGVGHRCLHKTQRRDARMLTKATS